MIDFNPIKNAKSENYIAGVTKIIANYKVKTLQKKSYTILIPILGNFISIQ